MDRDVEEKGEGERFWRSSEKTSNRMGAIRCLSSNVGSMGQGAEVPTYLGRGPA